MQVGLFTSNHGYETSFTLQRLGDIVNVMKLQTNFDMYVRM